MNKSTHLRLVSSRQDSNGDRVELWQDVDTGEVHTRHVDGRILRSVPKPTPAPAPEPAKAATPWDERWQPTNRPLPPLRK